MSVGAAPMDVATAAQVRDAVAQLAGIRSSLQPSLMDYLAIAASMLGAVFAGAAALVAARSLRHTATALADSRIAADAAVESTEIARRASATQQLDRLVAEFVSKEYLIRFWTLDVLLREMWGVRADYGTVVFRVLPFPPKQQGIAGMLAPEVAPDREFSLADTIAPAYCRKWGHLDEVGFMRDALGPPWSTSRSDLPAAYGLVLRLWSWVVAGEPSAVVDGDARFSDGPLIRGLIDGKPIPGRIAELNDAFGADLVNALVFHRAIAWRLFSSKHDFRYYWNAYGLWDIRYNALVDLLLEDASNRELLSDSQQEYAAISEMNLDSEPWGEGASPRYWKFLHEEWLDVSSPMYKPPSDSA
ncbi:MAG: hypothetical protein U1E26_04735 [Coriobacteriia bacterium]|nr:hypothetical protein [Coriobacteriia bacterium]